MKYSSEDDVKKALEIDSWRKLSRAKVVKFASMMPDMDKEVMLAIVNQLPVFTKFALDALGVIHKSHEATLDANKHSQDQSHEAYKDVREVIQGLVTAEDLSSEDRKWLVDALVSTADKQAAKDTENKAFIKDLLKYVVMGASVAVVAGVVFVGGQIALNQGDGESTG